MDEHPLLPIQKWWLAPEFEGSRINNFPFIHPGFRPSSPDLTQIRAPERWKLFMRRPWAGGGFEPETYMEYFEDSKPPSNAETGCKIPFPDGQTYPPSLQKSDWYIPSSRPGFAADSTSITFSEVFSIFFMQHGG
jgi:hypothetical protein